MAIVGDKEVEAGQVALRLKTGEMTGLMGIEELVTNLKKEIQSKSLEPLLQSQSEPGGTHS